MIRLRKSLRISMRNNRGGYIQRADRGCRIIILISAMSCFLCNGPKWPSSRWSSKTSKSTYRAFNRPYKC